MPQRIQRRRVKGWRMPPDAVYVGRGTIWGNPFVVGELDGGWSAPGSSEAEGPFRRVKNAAEAVRLYREALMDDPTSGEMLQSLRGKNLACWCPLDAPCHADVLLELANAG